MKIVVLKTVKKTKKNNTFKDIPDSGIWYAFCRALKVNLYLVLSF